MRMAPDFSLCTDRHQELLATMNRKQTAKIKSRGFNRVLTSDICLRYQCDQRDFNDQIDGQPRSQGLSSLPPLSLTLNDNGGREDRPCERG